MDCGLRKPLRRGSARLRPLVQNRHTAQSPQPEQHKGGSASKKASQEKQLRHNPLSYSDGRRSGAACRKEIVEAKESQGHIHGARLPFLQRRAAAELAGVLSDRKASGEIHGCSHHHKRGGLSAGKAEIPRERNSEDGRGGRGLGKIRTVGGKEWIS